MSHKLLVLPDDTARPLIDAIAGAKKSLNIRMFLFTDPTLIDTVIAAHRLPGRPLALGGFSFGAYVTTLAAARLEGDARASRLLLVGPSTQRALPADVPPDTVVIHGEADDVVPLSATMDWARPQQLPVIVMPGTGHFFHGQLTQLRDLIVRSWR